MTSATDRRAFLRTAASTTGGLIIAVHLPACSGRPEDRWGGPKDLVTNAQLRITPDNRVVFTLARVEMGQGTWTSQAMILAEELGLQPTELEVEFAPNHQDFAEPEYGVQVTGGSNSTRNGYPVLAKAGAIARSALLGAGAEHFGVSKNRLRLENKTVIDTASGTAVPLGALAERARNHIDARAEPKPRETWSVVGRDHIRLDAAAKVDGTARFGADYDPPGLENAVLLRGPLGARPVSFDADAAKKVRGVQAVEATPFGVAVIAKRYHQARKAAAQVRIEWSESTFSTEAMWKRYTQALDAPDAARGNARHDGDPDPAFRGASKVLEAEYRLPFLAHTTMEPQTCTAWVKDGGCEVWAPTQAPGQCQAAAARAADVPSDRVQVHQTLLGGGFGRRSESDFVSEAAWLSKRRGAPVRVQWSREDDIRHDFYRPASLHRLRGALKDGRPSAWEHRIVQQSAFVRPVGELLQELMPKPVAGIAMWAMTRFQNDGTIVEGAEHVPYAVPNVSVGYRAAEEPVPVGFWRSVGHSSNGFVVESFVDELAHAADRDPVEFRRALLKTHPRHRTVLDRAVEAAGWGGPLPEGHARGVAVHESFHSFVAVVAEVSVEEETVHVHRLTAAVDCGIAIHPDGVKAQIEGGMIFALGPTLTESEITFERGHVQQGNFHDCQALRYAQCPEVEVHIIESDEPPTGVGEPGVPPTAPAVANAVFALTGKRLRSLPLRLG